MNSSLNHVYSIVWNATLGLWQVASEVTRGRGKTGTSQQARKVRRALAAAGLTLAAPSAWAVLPTGGTVVAGQATINQAGNALNINQSTDKAAIDWQSFSVGQGNTVNFVQPNASSVALNRVLGNDVSVIQGAINANGQVFLVNQNGVLFTPTAQVNVGGIVASTQNISTDDFMSGKFKFSGNSTGTVENQGNITTADGGYVALIAAKVINSGTITVPQGTVGLAAGNTVLVDLGGPVKIQVTEGALNAAIEQSGGIRADGGTVYLTAKAAGNLAASVINHTGVTRALSMAALTGESTDTIGRIAVSADIVSQHGTLDVSAAPTGRRGGQIDVTASLLIDSGSTLADGQTDGGQITVKAHEVLQSQASTVSAVGMTGVGGWIQYLGGKTPGGNVYLSGRTLASGRRQGGRIDATADTVTLAGATFDTSGSGANARAGMQRIGGGWQGNDQDLANAVTTLLNNDTKLVNEGVDGTVVVWSDGKSVFGASLNARGSDVEISGKENLSASLDGVVAKTLLLDPKNITIVEAISTASFASMVIANPQGASSGVFGQSVIQLANENLIVADATTKSGLVNNAGRVYLFSKTGSLLATYVGVRENDMISSGGITVLKGANQNNFVINSPDFSTITSKVGAVTWVNGSTASGTTLITQSNSLVGLIADGRVGSGGITALTNGNFVVSSPDTSDTFTALKAGAVTFGNGATGVAGSVSRNVNSLVGTQTDNRIGSGGIFELSNGDYVVSSPEFSAARGAVTRVSGVDGKLATGSVNGTIVSNSEGNSLSGGTQGDRLSSGGIVALSDGGFVIVSPDYSYQPGSTLISKAGAVHWVAAGDSPKGSTNQYTKAIVGEFSNDRISSGGVTALNNGAFVVASPEWNSKRGAATFVGNGSSLNFITVNSTNSLTGASANDQVSLGGITKLSDGNYVVNSFKWNGNRGAVTWVNGTNGHITSSVGGITSTSLANTVVNNNSLVGSIVNDYVGSINTADGVGGVVALDNGRYVVGSSNWGTGFVTQNGAVTWSDANGVRGEVSESNSLIGNNNDKLGIGGIVKLSNGNYAVASGLVDVDGKTNAGLVAVVDGTQRLVGNIMTVSSYDGKLTRMTGAAASQSFGGTSGNTPGSNQFLYALNNGNLVVRSPSWNGNTGAVTWLSGDLTGTSSFPTAVSALNSLVGSKANDQFGLLNNPTSQPGVVQISDTHYAVISPRSNSFLGSVTFVSAIDGSINGTTSKGGTVNATNSILGNSENPFMGSDGAGAQRVFLLGELGANSKIAVANSLFAPGGGLLITDGKFVEVTGTPGLLTDGFGQFNGADNQGGANSSILRSTIQTALNNGTAVTLKANNDITVKDAVIANSNATGALTLEAGRSINFNANVNTGNGNLTAIAGAAGHIAEFRDAGDSTITLASGVKLSAGTGSINLIANNVGSHIGKFVNNAGANPFTAAKTFIYLPSYNTAGANATTYVTLGGLIVNGKRYGTTYNVDTKAPNCFVGCVVPTSGVNLFYAATPTLRVAPAAVTAVYGDSVAFTAAPELSGFVDGDTFATAGISGEASYQILGAPSNGLIDAGQYDVIYQSGLLSSLGYQFDNLDTQTNELTITPKVLTVAFQATTANPLSKVYDGNKTLMLDSANFVLSGFVGQQGEGAALINVTQGDLNSQHVLEANSVSVDVTQGSVTGTDRNFKASNYHLPESPVTATATITPKALTITGSTAASKTYDGDNKATITVGTVTGFVGDETLGMTTAVGTFADKNAAKNKDVTVAYTLVDGGTFIPGFPIIGAGGMIVGFMPEVNIPGAKASNYSLAGETLKADINQKQVTISGFTAQNKVYDGNTTATINDGTQINGLIAADADKVSLTNLAATFDTRNVGKAKTVTLNQASLTGAEADNYVLSTDAVITQADITAKALTIAATADNKVYDGNTDAVVTLSSNDLVQGDKLKFGKTSASFADKNVGNGKTVTISGLTLTGDDAGNYVILNANNGATATANITRLDSVTWVGGANGDWFDANNWADGAVPDLSNVANVIIPDGTVVFFSGMDATPVNLDSLGNQGELAMMAGALNVGNGGVTLGGFNQTGGSVSTTGNFAVTQIEDNTQVGNLTVGGNLSLTNTVGSIGQLAGSTVAVTGTTTLVGGTADKRTDVSLNSNTNSFKGAVSATGKDVILNANGALTAAITAAGQANLSAASNLAVSGSTKAGLTTTTTGMGSSTTFGNTTVGTDLTVTSTGKVAQVANTALTVGGKSAINATGQDVDLSNSGNDFDSVGVTANAVSITDKNGVALDAVNAVSLAVKAGGAVTQVADKALTVSGATSVDAGINAVTLANQGNDFASIGVKGGAVSITDKNAVALDAISATSLALKAGGAVTQVAEKSLEVSGATSVDAGTHDVTLANTGNDFNSIAITGGAVSITDKNAVVLDAVKALSLTIKAGGDVSQTAAATVVGATSVDAKGFDVSLNNAGNDFNSVGVTAKAVSITDKNGVALDAISATSLAVKAGGAVTQVTDKALLVTGATTVDAGTNAVTLANAGNDFGSVGVTGRAVSITDTNAVALDAISATSLTVKAGGAVTQNAAATVTGNTTVDATGFDVSLNAKGNDLTVLNATAKDLTVSDEKGGIILGGITATGNTSLTSTGGDILQGDSGAALVFSGKTTLNAKNGDKAAAVTLNGGNNTFTGVVSATGSTVDLKSKGALSAEVTATDATLSANGNLAVSGTTTNNLSTTTTGENSTTTFGQATVGGALSTTSTGNVSQQLNTAMAVTGGATITATGKDVSLGNAGNDFGTFNATAKDVTVADAKGGVVLGNITATGNTSVTSTGGAITQALNGEALVLSGTTTLNAKDGENAAAVTLNGAKNTLTGAVSATGSAVTLNAQGAMTAAVTAAEATLSAAGNLGVSGTITKGLTTTTTGMGSTTTFGTTSVGTDLSVTSAGKVAQLDDKATLSVGNKATVTATGQDVTLANSGNNFGSVGVTGGAVSITDKEALALDAINVTSLTVKAGGAVTQNAAATVTGLTSVDAGTHNVTLNQANNAFGSVAVTGGAVSITDKEALALDAIKATSLTVKAGGAMTQVADKALLVTGATTVDAEGFDVSLGSAGNNFGSVSATAKNLTIADAMSGVVLGQITATGNTSVTSTGGAITQAEGSVINAAGTTSLSASADGQSANVTLTSANNTLTGEVSATGAAVSLNAKDALTAVVDAEQATLNASSNLVVSGTTTQSLTTTSTGENSTTTFGTTKVGGDLSVTSTSNVSQQAKTVLSVVGTTTINAMGKDVSLANDSNDFAIVNVNAKDVSLVDTDGGVVLGSVQTTGNFNLSNTNGDMTQTPDGAMQIEGNISLVSTDNIDLPNLDNRFDGNFSITGQDVKLGSNSLIRIVQRDVRSLVLQGGPNANVTEREAAIANANRITLPELQPTVVTGSANAIDVGAEAPPFFVTGFDGTKQLPGQVLVVRGGIRLPNMSDEEQQ